MTNNTHEALRKEIIAELGLWYGLSESGDLENKIADNILAIFDTATKELVRERCWISKSEVKEAYMVAMAMSSFDGVISVLWKEINERLEAALQTPPKLEGKG